MDEKLAKAFLEEYEQLCRKHGILVGSCGCCESPWLVVLSKDWEDELKDHIKHLTEAEGTHN